MAMPDHHLKPSTDPRAVENKWARNQIHAAKNKGIVERLIGQLVGLTIL
jgi:hypothetical protein